MGESQSSPFRYLINHGGTVASLEEQLERIRTRTVLRRWGIASAELQDEGRSVAELRLPASGTILRPAQRYPDKAWRPVEFLELSRRYGE